MPLKVFTNLFRPIEFNPKPKPLPKPQPEEAAPVKKFEAQTVEANKRTVLEKKWDANKPDPSSALEKISRLPQPDENDKKAIIEFKLERRKIAENAVNNSNPPKLRDFLSKGSIFGSGLKNRIAYLEYRAAKTGFYSQIAKLKTISKDAAQYPEKILSPGEAAVKIFNLPRPDRNNPAEIKKYNQARADIADAALLYKSASPKISDFTNHGTNRFAHFEYEEAVRNHYETVQNLKEYSQSRYSIDPPPINATEADKAATRLINNHGGNLDETQASALGKDLAKLAKTNSGDAAAVMIKVQEKLAGTEKGDNVADGFLSSLSDKELDGLAGTYEGEQMLAGLKPHLLSGSIYDGERKQAARIDFAVLKKTDAVEAASRKVEKAYKNDGHAEAARVLREETENLSPEETAVVLRRAKPTIDKIFKDLNDDAESADDDYDYTYNPRYSAVKPTISFDQTLTDLGSAINHAAESPNGKQVVKDFAKPIVDYIKKEGVGRYDESLGKIIGASGGAELTVEVISQLKAAGNIDEADDILQNVKDGVNELKDSINDAVKDYAKEATEFQWLLKNWGPMMERKELQNAIKGYMRDHPELNEKFEAIDKLTGSAVKTLNALETMPADFKSLDHFDDAEDSAKDFINGKKVKDLILTMPSATKEFSTLVNLQTEGKPTLLDKLKEPSGLIKDSKEFSEKMSNVVLKATVNSAIEARLSRNPVKARQIVENLKSYANLFGVGDEDLNKAVNGLKAVQTADSEADAKLKLKQLNKDLSVDALAADKPLGRAFRGAGILLSLPGTIDNLKSGDPLKTAQGLTSVVGLGADSAELLAGVIKGGKLSSLVESPGFAATGKVLGVVGLVFDGISLVDNLTGDDKDLVGAGLDVAGIGGGATVLFAGGPYTLAAGAIIVIGAAIGKAIWGHSKETKKYETETTEKFLRDGGINAGVARELRNQDGDGNSPGPVFAALAKMNGVDPKEFFDYLNTLPKDKAHDLVVKAHGVDPEKNGNYPRHEVLMLGEVDKIHPVDNPYVFDLTELGEWMKTHGYRDAPGI